MSWTSIVGYFGAVIGIAIGLEVWQPQFLPELAPVEGQGGLETLWQVQAALVSVALPLLFALIPLVRDERLAATSTAELLLDDTHLSRVLFFAMGGLVCSGLAAMWLEAPPAKWLIFGAVLVPTVVAVVVVYARSARILSNPLYVRQASRRLLMRRLDNSIVTAAAMEFANGELVARLTMAGFSTDAGRITRGPARVELLSPIDGRVVDVDLAALERWLAWIRSVPRTIPTPVHPDTDPLQENVATARLEEANEVGVWCFLIGDELGFGRPLASLEPGFEGLDAGRAAAELLACIRIESDG